MGEGLDSNETCGMWYSCKNRGGNGGFGDFLNSTSTSSSSLQDAKERFSFFPRASCKLETTIVCRNLDPEAPPLRGCMAHSSASLAEAVRGGFGGCPSNKSRSTRSKLAAQAAARPATRSAIVAGHARRHDKRGRRARESLCSLENSLAPSGTEQCEAARKRGAEQRGRSRRGSLTLALHK